MKASPKPKRPNQATPSRRHRAQAASLQFSQTITGPARTRDGSVYDLVPCHAGGHGKNRHVSGFRLHRQPEVDAPRVRDPRFKRGLKHSDDGRHGVTQAQRTVRTLCAKTEIDRYRLEQQFTESEAALKCVSQFLDLPLEAKRLLLPLYIDELKGYGITDPSMLLV